MSDTAIIGRECRFAIHVPSTHQDMSDLHIVKELLHFSDGTKKKNLRFVENYKRPYGITKPAMRKHEQKKEFERIDNLTIRRATQSDLKHHIARALDKGFERGPLNQLFKSPYVYGAEISSTSLIKGEYRAKYPNFNTPYDVLFFDIETDVNHGTNDPIITSITHDSGVYLYTTKEYVKGYANVDSQVYTMINKYLKEYLEKLNLKVEFKVFEDTVDLLRGSFNKIHELEPDFVAIWNMDFDIPRCISTLEKYGVDPASILSDPRVPRARRICKYKQGSTKLVTASGKVKPKAPHDQWHHLHCTASWIVIDQMCSFKLLRMGEQERNSYALDAVMTDELGGGKFIIPQAENLYGLAYHQVMQSQYRLEYLVYAIVDTTRMLELNRKNKDLSIRVPAMADVSDFDRLNSQPKRLIDRLHYYFLDKGVMIGTTSPREKKKDEDLLNVDQDEVAEDDDVEDELSSEVDNQIDLENDILSLKNWIVTLPAFLSSLGLKLVKEDANLRTLIRCFVSDSDAVSAYPSCIETANVSKSTTRREIVRIGDIEETTFRLNNINILSGHPNSIEYATEMFNMPTLFELRKHLG